MRIDCHEDLRKISNVKDILFNEQGRVIKDNDICKYCKKVITVDQKMYMLE